MDHLNGLLAGLDVSLSDDILDRIDDIVPPGTDVGTLDQRRTTRWRGGLGAGEAVAGRLRGSGGALAGLESGYPAAVDGARTWSRLSVPAPHSSTASSSSDPTTTTNQKPLKIFIYRS